MNDLIETAGGAKLFTFGDAESVLDRRELLDHVESLWNGKWFEPPVPLRALARCYRVSPHHSSAIIVKRNLLLRHFRPHRLLGRGDFGKWALDFLVMGNAYLERVDNLAGRPMALKHSLSLYTRRGRDDGQFYFLPKGNWGRLGQVHEFARGSMFQLSEPDVAQEIYGLPEYLSAMQSAFLNEGATLFRRRYYLNGSHAGFVFYLSEATIDNQDVDDIREALRKSKGPGNFRNLFINAPNGKKDGVQIIPISEVAAKDEFLGIKGTTRDDILAAHRVPPQLLGVIPQNNGGFGDVRTATDVFFDNEIVPLQTRTLELNDWAGEEIIAYDDYQPAAPAQPSPAS
ncbi:phage portal protein [Sphingobium lignivorans]|uniref:PBSX family phage portal protein n=1 Tax=Sphingobium lignivorans TaxID=2735886 RepID=A0ABR6NE06_9SPHN|nr:phage portal protein [Sphingobium lignivorans]MBB5985296.1 PBSX family phage portal protein [Sphingobium lignivorans]